PTWAHRASLPSSDHLSPNRRDHFGDRSRAVKYCNSATVLRSVARDVFVISGFPATCRATASPRSLGATPPPFLTVRATSWLLLSTCDCRAGVVGQSRAMANLSLAGSRRGCILNQCSCCLRFADFRGFKHFVTAGVGAVSARTAREGQLPQRYSQQSHSNAGRADASWQQHGIGLHSPPRPHDAAGGTVAVTYEPRSKRIRLLVIEDHRMLRDAIAKM